MEGQLLKEFLEEKYLLYNTPNFIVDDPISIPHTFHLKEDIEIAGFIAASLAWGQRPTIINKCKQLLSWMDYAPYEFVMNAQDSDLEKFREFKHRTFNGEDCFYFIKALKNIYQSHGGLEKVFSEAYMRYGEMKGTLRIFREVFMSYSPLNRTEKHVANVEKGSGAKRLNMFLRWMVRKEGKVDFGLWNKIPTSSLYMPLDLHTGNVSRKLEILTRKQNDWRAVDELTSQLRKLDANDPVKYDFALFGLGIYEGF